MLKVLSIVDYSLNFEVLHYQYDRWLFKTSLLPSIYLEHQAVVQTAVFSRNLVLLPTGSGSTFTSSSCPPVWLPIILRDHQPVRMDLSLAFICSGSSPRPVLGAHRSVHIGDVPCGAHRGAESQGLPDWGQL